MNNPSQSTMKDTITRVWSNTLQEPPRWSETEGPDPALYDQPTGQGIHFDRGESNWTLGWVTPNGAEFIPSAGPFALLGEAVIALIATVAATRAAQELSQQD